jgi:hypothetical protein
MKTMKSPFAKQPTKGVLIGMGILNRPATDFKQ